MTIFEKTVDGVESRFELDRKFLDVPALGRWVNPLLGGLGALVLSGYLLTGSPPTPVVTAAALVSVAQVAPSPPPSQLALSNEIGIATNSGVVRDESIRTSILDLMKAAFGAVLALAWAMVGAWLGMRRARMLAPVHENEYDGHSTTFLTAGTNCDPPRAPTCERMFDETRLVPQYLRDTEFPATRRDLVRLAEVYTDEGCALRRLERVPDRRYNSLHDLIAEFRVD
jgi:hypothetical protein